MDTIPYRLNESDWMAHPGCEGAQEMERLLIERRADVWCYGTVEDAEASYSYEDYALVSLDDVFYLLRTSGCSCPSPTETWGVIHYGTLDEIEKYLRDDVADPQGFTVTKRQADEFMALVSKARDNATSIAAVLR